MKKNVFIAALLAIFSGVMLITIAIHASVSPNEQRTSVKIDNFTFNPATVTVKAGSTVHGRTVMIFLTTWPAQTSSSNRR
jgi:plastocyanin